MILHTQKKHLAIAMMLSAAASAHAVEIANPGFESNWTGWQDTDPSAISSDSNSGSKAAKITGSAGRAEQEVSLSANTLYKLEAYVKGSGKIGAELNGQTFSTIGGGSSYELVSIEFDSGMASSATIFAAHGGSEGRFDDFTLTEVGTSGGGTGGGTGDSGGTVDCTGETNLTILTATDDGTNDGHGPNNTIDEDLSDGSRWSSNGFGKTITYDLGQLATVKSLQIKWFKGNSRSSYFEVESSTDNSSWTPVLTNGQSSGSSSSYETIDVIDSDARYVRIIGQQNSSNSWNSIIETNIYGCSESSGEGGSGGGNNGGGNTALDLELQDWYLGVPIDENGDGKSDSISENSLVAGYEHSQWFYRDADGALVFKAPIDAPKTSTNTSYTRSELREMLRRGDTSISTKGINANNWVFSTHSSSDRNAAGGIDGELTATLKVDYVTTTGSSSQVGRVIIGQIHATNDEPARLYYRKLPGNTKGSIYLAHEINGGNDLKFDLIGSNSSSASNPSDGIELGEVFSYSIKVSGNDLIVSIYRDGKPTVTQTVDMSNSGYHNSSGEYMYFKAGVYNQNNTGDSNDYVQATFYKIVNKHTGYAH